MYRSNFDFIDFIETIWMLAKCKDLACNFETVGYLISNKKVKF